MKNRTFDKNEMKLLVVVCFALFTIPLTITSSSVFDLSVMKNFGLSYYKAQWFITTYMVFYASFLAVSGSFSDIYGRRKILLLGLSLSFIGFIAGGITTNYYLLLITRSICGVGAAAITTSTTALLAANLTELKTEKAFAIFGSAIGIGMISGPVIAGLSVAHSNGWKIFSFAMASILLMTFIFTLKTHEKFKKIKIRIDWLGSMVLTIALLLTVLSFSFMPIWGYLNIKSLLCSAFGFSFFLLLWRIERKTSNPIINFDIFKFKNFRAMCITTVLLGFGYIGLLFYLPYYLKIHTSLTNTSIGLAATIATIPSLVLPPLIAKFKKYLSNVKLLVTTFICLVIGPLALCIVIESHSLIVYVLPLLIFGSSFGISLSFIDGEAVSSVDSKQSGIAAGTFNTFRIGGESIAIPLLSVIVSLFSRYTSNIPALTLIAKVKGLSINNYVSPYAMELTLITVSLICILMATFVIKTTLYRARGA